MAEAQEVVALPLTELVSSKFMFSKKETKTWNFLNKKNNKQTAGSNDWVEVWYETPGQKLAFVLENVKSTSGIQTTDSFKRGFMSLNLSPEQSKQIKSAVDDHIFTLAFQHREDLFKPGRKMVQPAEMKFLFKGVVKDGEEKTEKKNPDGSKGKPIKGPDGKAQYWNDSVTGNIAMKKKAQQVVVDDNQCQVVDLEGRSYVWSNLENKLMREVIVEVEKVVFSDKVVVHCTFRCIVPNEVGGGGVKYTTKRRLEQEKEAQTAGETKEGETKDGTAGDTTTAPATTAAPPAAAAPATTTESAPPPSKKARATAA